MGNGIFNGPEGAQDAVIIDQLWHSDIIMGKTPLDPIAWKEWPTTGVNPLQNVQMEEWSGLRTPSGNEWKDLCVVETWIASNNTLIRHVVTGPEDPKVSWSWPLIRRSRTAATWRACVVGTSKAC